MPSNHISNFDYHQNLTVPVDWERLYKEKAIDLDYLHVTGDAYHEALKVTHLSEESTWNKIKDKRRLT